MDSSIPSSQEANPTNTDQTNPPKKPISNVISEESKYLKEQINLLRTGDDMDIMTCLINLSDHLSLSSDQIADDPNMPTLLEEICRNLEKTYISELIIYTLQCINNILDINPAFTQTLKKIGAIPKIIILMTAIEDLTCLESIIKILEKISYENSFILLENNTFTSLLNVIDFLGENQRKSVMNACVNMVINCSSYHSFCSYIKPSLMTIATLTQYNESDIKTTNKAILIFFYIVYHMKTNNYIKTNPEIETEIFKYCFLDNLSEIVQRYLLNPNDKKIGSDLIKTILKIFTSLCNCSNLSFDKLVEIKFLHIIVEMIQNEFNLNESSHKNNNEGGFPVEKNQVSFLSELFPLLNSFFPSSPEAKEKILSEKNKDYYVFFCSQILQPIIKNIMLKSACSTLNLVMQLMIRFGQSATKETIMTYMESKAIAQIISKLLDTKYLPYLVDNISILTILMEKAPEYYIVSFIREGIIEGMKNFTFSYKGEEKTQKEIKNEENNLNNGEGDSESPEYIVEDEMSCEIDDGFIEEQKKETEKNDKEDNNNNIINNTNDDKKKVLEKKNNDSTKNLSLLQKKFKEIEKEFKSTTETINNTIDINNKLLKKAQKYLATNIDTQYSPYSKFGEIRSIEAKLKAFNEKYLSDEKIENLLKNQLNNNSNLKNILTNSKNELLSLIEKNSNEKDIIIKLNEIINILCNPSNELTLFELESSQVLLALCTFFEGNFVQMNNLIKDEDLKETKLNLSEISHLIKFNKDIVHKVQILFKCLQNDKTKIENLIKILQYTITSMNCFTMLIDEANSNNLNIIFNEAVQATKKSEIKIIYNEAIYNDTILKDMSLNENFKLKLAEYHNSFKQSKELRISVSHKSLFKDIANLLLSNTSISFESDSKYEIKIDFSLDIFLKDKTETILIDNNWKYKDLEKETIKRYTKENISYTVFKSTPIKFGLSYKLKEPKTANLTKESKKRRILNDLLNLPPIVNPNNNYSTIEKQIFERFYHYNIIYNINLYEIKRLMPSLYLMSLLYFPITSFSSLFEIQPNLFRKEEIDNLFINPKVTLLISRASRDGYSVSKSSVPSWCYNLSMDFNFLSKFPARHLLFKVSFDPKRSLINLQNYLKCFDPSFSTSNQIVITKGFRLKVIVERDSIIQYAIKFLNDPITSKFIGYLEFEYLNEIGNGIGPTLEFYSLVVEKLKLDKKLWYKTTDNSLFPTIINKKENNKDILNKWQLLGFIVARALYDDRLIDIPLSKIFWDIVLERAVPISSIEIIDKDLGKIMNDFLALSKRKIKFIEEFKANNPNIKDNTILEKEITKNILYSNSSLDSLDIYFTFPGYSEIELKQGGKDIQLTILNLEEYISLVYDTLLDNGTKEIVNSFKKGFTSVFSLSNLKIFNSTEIEESICGSLDNKWEEGNLFDNIKAEHGMVKGSRLFKDLIKYMCSLDKKDKKKFLTFVTGTSRLPIGGFKNLSPKLTVVKRTCSPKEYPDDFLPTVMTCQNYLKLPEYSSYDILKEKITKAMNEGTNEFHLS